MLLCSIFIVNQDLTAPNNKNGHLHAVMSVDLPQYSRISEAILNRQCSICPISRISKIGSLKSDDVDAQKDNIELNFDFTYESRVCLLSKLSRN